MPLPWMTRFEPTIFATGTTEVTCAVGMPAFSSSVAIAAPLRVEVPQHETRMTASILSSLSFSAISRPRRRLFASGFASPEVEMKFS